MFQVMFHQVPSHGSITQRFAAWWCLLVLFDSLSGGLPLRAVDASCVSHFVFHPLTTRAVFSEKSRVRILNQSGQTAISTALDSDAALNAGRAARE